MSSPFAVVLASAPTGNPGAAPERCEVEHMHSHHTDASETPGHARPRLIRSPPVAEDSDASARGDGGEDGSGSPPGPPTDAADGGSGLAPQQTTRARPG